MLFEVINFRGDHLEKSICLYVGVENISEIKKYITERSKITGNTDSRNAYHSLLCIPHPLELRISCSINPGN